MKNIILIIFGFIFLNASAGSNIAVKPMVTDASCHGTNTGSIVLTVAGGVAPYTFSWDQSLPASATQTNLAAGTYNVTVTDNNSNTTTAKVVVRQPMAINISVAAKDIALNAGDEGEININVTGGNPGYSFLWSNNSTNQNIWDLAAGTYGVIVTDAAGCTATASATIHQMVMLPAPNEQAYSMQNTNEEVVARAKSTPTAVEEVKNNSSLLVYPIPANNVVNVKGLDNGSEITLLNYAGQVIEQKKANTAETQVNVQDLPTGNYIMVIKNGDVTTNKLVSVIK